MKKLAALSLLLAATACTVVPAERAPSKAKPGTGTDAKPGEDGKPADGKPADGTPADGEVKTGIVSLTQTSIQAGPTVFNSFSAFAFFSAAKAAAAGAGGVACKTSEDGACSITECTTPAAQDPATTDAGAPVQAAKAPHAGEITVGAAQTVALVADDKGAYTAKTGQTELWAAGADISIKAAGDTVPAFDKTLKAPGTVTVTEPAWPAAGAALNIDRGAALPLAWTDGADGFVTVSLTGSAAGNTSIISCKFPAKDNAGTISAAAMGKLVATEQGSISVNASSVEAFEQAGWKITVSANAPAKAGASFASGLAKIQ